jgi:hypothetical protein
MLALSQVNSISKYMVFRNTVIVTQNTKPAYCDEKMQRNDALTHVLRH